MGSITKSLFSLAIIFLAAIIFIGIVLPKNVTISVTQEINCDSNQAFELVSNINNWDRWSPWKTIDNNAHIEISDSTIGKNSWYKWKGNWRIGEKVKSSTKRKLKYFLIFYPINKL